MTGTCYDCGARLEVRARDGVEKITGPSDEEWYCPVCNDQGADR